LKRGFIRHAPFLIDVPSLTVPVLNFESRNLSMNIRPNIAVIALKHAYELALNQALNRTERRHGNPQEGPHTYLEINQREPVINFEIAH
jgi:hypothetical protein